MKNVHKIKIKLENIWIDLIMGIYAPYTTSIGPGDQSEEACSSVTTDRHQIEGDMTEKNRRDGLTSMHRPRTTRNKQQNAVTAG